MESSFYHFKSSFKFHEKILVNYSEWHNVKVIQYFYFRHDLNDRMQRDEEVCNV